ncbi:hypothetical protein GQ43DRAFT_462606 [Delitschia confertaspora ATCC 74209]|uniref:EB domain-containing protein n=1 Tax=Delitschia confertaspora ATCC 74209 TaxID=1513339 RepID=A0A9P4MTK3_9PLEO|nr:hypothetical protein GQ43DRAFT_462606 [Delitschia confertaspora ATCC 74209]
MRNAFLFGHSLLFFLTFLSTTVTSDHLIDPRTIPTEDCTGTSCYYDDKLPDQICPVDVSQCTSNSSNCGMYHSDCYCKLKTGLRCAWPCRWWSWMKVEDWFFDQCPDSPAIDLEKAPSCASGCLDEKLVDYGCLTKNTNCFCIQGGLFGCQEKCRGHGRDQLKSWLVDTCNITPAQAEAGVFTGDFSTTMEGNSVREPIFTPRKKKKLRWYEIMAITLASFSGVVASFFWIWMKHGDWMKQSKFYTPIKKRINCDQKSLA